MKRAISFVAITFSLSLSGCADLQNQASGYLPGATAQPASTVAMEGGQKVQYIPGTGQNSVATNAGTNQNEEESSFLGDMVKSATDSVKSEATSGVRSAVRGMFSR
ncbi:hypothetical protein [Pseudomonas sp. ML2-2023-6]|uniref:hypothetical protein n=1 Tax=Pseudomonas sp. ML2-2023-6 TaxID=3122376 RepID=UPI0030D20E1B